MRLMIRDHALLLLVAGPLAFGFGYASNVHPMIAFFVAFMATHVACLVLRALRWEAWTR